VEVSFEVLEAVYPAPGFESLEVEVGDILKYKDGSA
jgi:DNA-binding Xre family transcriptional regulator